MDQRRFHALAGEERFDGAYVAVPLQPAGSEGVAEACGVTRLAMPAPFDSLLDGILHSVLQSLGSLSHANRQKSGFVQGREL